MPQRLGSGSGVTKVELVPLGWQLQIIARSQGEAMWWRLEKQQCSDRSSGRFSLSFSKNVGGGWDWLTPKTPGPRSTLWLPVVWGTHRHRVRRVRLYFIYYHEGLWLTDNALAAWLTPLNNVIRWRTTSGTFSSPIWDDKTQFYSEPSHLSLFLNLYLLLICRKNISCTVVRTLWLGEWEAKLA